jgi:hypothetical protein
MLDSDLCMSVSFSTLAAGHCRSLLHFLLSLFLIELLHFFCSWTGNLILSCQHLERKPVQPEGHWNVHQQLIKNEKQSEGMEAQFVWNREQS